MTAIMPAQLSVSLHVSLLPGFPIRTLAGSVCTHQYCGGGKITEVPH